jgi:hypothetical protein
MHQLMTDIAVRLLSFHVAHRQYPFIFRAAKHTLYRRVMPAISTMGFALAHACACIVLIRHEVTESQLILKIFFII